MLKGVRTMLDQANEVLRWPFARTAEGLPPVVLSRLREAPACPVELPSGAVESHRAWLVTTYDDVKQALMDPRLSADETRPGAPVRIQLPPGERPSSFLRMDDPEHAELRGLITTEFTARRIREMTPLVLRRINELLDELATRPGQADLQDMFTRKLPTTIIADVLGVPTADTGGFVEVTRKTLSQEDPRVSLAAYNQMNDYLTQLATEKLHHPTDDLISRVAVAHVRTGRIRMAQLVGISRLVLVAGHETTTNQLALSVLSLLQDAELRSRVLADGGARLLDYVEEAMRYWSISQDAILRQATEDLTLGGVEITAGEPVVISIPAANHDPSVFPHPDRIDLDRDGGKHLQWGYGPHYCQGAPLARLEMEHALRELFKRFPTLELDTTDVSELFKRNTVFFGVHRLPVRW